MNLSRGIKKSPVRAVIYSPEGRGKSTLASLLPDPVFVDVEGGTHQLDVIRVEPGNWAEVLAAIADIGGNHAKEFRTVVFDTADWLERMCIQDLCAKSQKESIEDFGYGKGYVHLAEKFATIFKYAERLIQLGLNVVFLAHSRTVKVSPPDQLSGFNKYEVALHDSDKTSNLRQLKEWADMVLFINVATSIVAGSDGKTKATGGTERVIHCVGTAAFDAKNRHSLPDTLQLEKGILPPELRRIFFDQVAPTVAKDNEIPGVGADDSVQAPVPAEARRENSPVHAPTVPKAAGEPAPTPLPVNEQPQELRNVPTPIIGEVPGTFADPDLAKMFGGQEAAAHAFLVFAKWLGENEPLSALKAERVAQIKARPGPFAVKAKLTLNQGAA